MWTRWIQSKIGVGHSCLHEKWWGGVVWRRYKSNTYAMSRNWRNQNQDPVLKTKTGTN